MYTAVLGGASPSAFSQHEPLGDVTNLIFPTPLAKNAESESQKATPPGGPKPFSFSLDSDINRLVPLFPDLAMAAAFDFFIGGATPSAAGGPSPPPAPAPLIYRASKRFISPRRTKARARYRLRAAKKRKAKFKTVRWKRMKEVHRAFLNESLHDEVHEEAAEPTPSPAFADVELITTPAPSHGKVAAIVVTEQSGRTQRHQQEVGELKAEISRAKTEAAAELKAVLLEAKRNAAKAKEAARKAADKENESLSASAVEIMRNDLLRQKYVEALQQNELSRAAPRIQAEAVRKLKAALLEEAERNAGQANEHRKEKCALQLEMQVLQKRNQELSTMVMWYQRGYVQQPMMMMPSMAVAWPPNDTAPPYLPTMPPLPTA